MICKRTVSVILIVEGKAFNQSAGNPIENYGIKRPFRGNKEDLNPAERTEDEEKKWDAGTRLPPL